jgi:mRNA interferase RelE/StbE
VAYTVELSNQAKRDLAALSPELQTRIVKALRTLEVKPRPSGMKKLKGEENTYRLQVGDYRVLYEVHDKRLLGLAVKIGHRREIYR